MKFNRLALTLICGLASACAHTPPTENRQPAAGSAAQRLTEFDGSPVTEATVFSPAQSHASSEELAEMEDVIHQRNAKKIAQFFWHISTSQSLVSAFDMHLTKSRKAEDVDKLLASEFYCQLQLSRQETEPITDQLIHGFKVAKTPEERRWVYEQMNKFAGQSALNEATMINLARALNYADKEICGKAGCVKSDIQQVIFRVDPFNDEASARYIEQRRSEIAKHNTIQAAHLKPGKCFNSGRAPAQATTYIWSQRNWVGGNSALSPGEFVITYDDGPHEQYTDEIQKIWTDAELVKPAFFWKSSEVAKLQQLVANSASAGYTIGSHSERHGDLGNIAQSGSSIELSPRNKDLYGDILGEVNRFNSFKNLILTREITNSIKNIGQVTGQKIRYFRLPFGSGLRNEAIGGRLAKADVEHFYWRVDSLDWQDTNPTSIRNRVLNQMDAVGNGIILFHDVHPQTVLTTKLLVEYLRNSNQYKAVPLTSMKGLPTK